MTTHVDSPDQLASLVGKELGTSAPRQITQTMIDEFARLSGDHQWIHIDPVRAAQGPFGTTVAHGYLTLSLIAPMIHEVLTTNHSGHRVNYGLNKVRFPSPVLVDSTIWSTVTLRDYDVINDAVQILLDIVVYSSHSPKPVCVAQGVYRFYGES